MNDQTARLARLGAYLASHRLDVDLTSYGLLVRNPAAPACCSEAKQGSLADTVTCRPRHEDSGRLWFYTSWREPIADARRVSDAVDEIKKYLGVRHAS
ncbi:hypothetical protein [Actinomadura sp. HBU206391]|uniref:hypothetical protein n=1 Tax=Actinomadura sp. HBU206391 TaxID=2731692 RepID=UPI001C9BFC5F|nr:hypothetical protein [Actinomadura sp. HBU206391]